MKSAAAAGLAEDVVEGFEAVVKLRWEGDDVAMKLLSGLRTETSRRRLHDRLGRLGRRRLEGHGQGRHPVGMQAPPLRRRRPGVVAACGKDGCEGCGGCPFQGEGDSKKEVRPQVEEF